MKIEVFSSGNFFQRLGSRSKLFPSSFALEVLVKIMPNRRLWCYLFRLSRYIHYFTHFFLNEKLHMPIFYDSIKQIYHSSPKNYVWKSLVLE